MVVPLRLCACLLLLVLVAGCDRPTEPRDDRLPLYPVRGRVSLHGHPVEGAFIVFHPEYAPSDAGQPCPWGTTGADGSFALGTYAKGDGAPAGSYVVSIIWAPDRGKPDRLAGRYANLADPQLRAVVLKGANDLPEFWLR
jgi:hypothetical protein